MNDEGSSRTGRVITATDPEYVSIPTAISLIVEWRTGQRALAGQRIGHFDPHRGLLTVTKPKKGSAYHRVAGSDLLHDMISGVVPYFAEKGGAEGKTTYDIMHPEMARGEVGNHIIMSGLTRGDDRLICIRRSDLEKKYAKASYSIGPLERCVAFLQNEKASGQALRKVLEPKAIKNIKGLTVRDFAAAYSRVFKRRRGRPRSAER